MASQTTFEQYDRVTYTGPAIDEGSDADMDRVRVDTGESGSVVRILKRSVWVAFRRGTADLPYSTIEVSL